MTNHTTEFGATDSRADIAIVYDGECPFCQQYTRLVQLRASAGVVRLIDARNEDPLVLELLNRGYDLDQGMVIKVAEHHYHGAEAMHVIAMLSTRSGWFNKFNYYLFRSTRWSAIIYPILRTGRNLLLRLLGRKPIGNRQ